MHHLKIEFLKAKNQIANQYYSGVPNNSPPRLLIFAYFVGPPPPFFPLSFFPLYSFECLNPSNLTFRILKQILFILTLEVSIIKSEIFWFNRD